MSFQRKQKRLKKILKSTSRLKTLIKELKEDLDEYGDDRNSNLVEAEDAKAFDEKDLISNDPMTDGAFKERMDQSR